MAERTALQLVPKPLTVSNDLDAYATIFELLANLQRGKRTETDQERNDQPHYFTFKFQQSAIDYYKTLPEAAQKDYGELRKLFRTHYKEKPVMFRGHQVKRMQQPGAKLTYYQDLASGVYLADSEGKKSSWWYVAFLEESATRK